MDEAIKEAQKERFAYLDNVRSLIIFLVVAMHSAVTYSGMGGWYYIEGSSDNLSLLEYVIFGFFQSFGQAWFMGVLFFISAYLATKALARRGFSGFIKERFFRLGLPLLIYMFIISPFNMFILLRFNPENTIMENYIQFIIGFRWLSATGPLWYCQVLLFFCIVYAILRQFILKPLKLKRISSFIIINAVILTTIVAFIIRLYFPIGSSFLNLQFGYFASYVVLFITGIVIGENCLWDNIADNKNIKWFILTLLIAMPIWSVIMVFGGAAQEGLNKFNGGLHWQSFAFSLWESFVAVYFSIGIIALFKRKANIENKFTRLMKDNAFVVYCFHSTILVSISLMFKHLRLSPGLKFAIVTIVAFACCLMFSFLIRKIKPIGILFK